MGDKTTLIMTAVYAEAGPLISSLRLAYAGDADGAGGRYERDDVCLYVSGMGAVRARQTIERALSAVEPGRVIVAGVSGGLDAALEVGDVVEVGRVIDDVSGDVFEACAEEEAAADVARRGVLVTVGEVASTPGEKAALRQRWSADVVDMETAAIARVCDAAGVPWRCVRAVSDGSGDALPRGVERLINAAGRPRMLTSMLYALTRPHRIGALMRLGRNTSHASAKLAERVTRMCR